MPQHGVVLPDPALQACSPCSSSATAHREQRTQDPGGRMPLLRAPARVLAGHNCAEFSMACQVSQQTGLFHLAMAVSMEAAAQTQLSLSCAAFLQGGRTGRQGCR